MIDAALIVAALVGAAFIASRVFRRVPSGSGFEGGIRTAAVRHVIDGDTVVVSSGLSKVTLRLDGIDCPEIDQLWGDIARYGLIKLIGGRTIRYEAHALD